MVKAHGLSGEVVVVPQTDDPARFSRGRSVYTGDGRVLTVKSNKPGDKGWLVSFDQIDDRNRAEGLVGLDLLIDSRDRRALRRDEFWPDQLIGLEVRDLESQTIGRLTDVDDSMNQARLLISTPTGEVEIPFVDEIVPEVNLESGYLVVAPIPGLLD